MKNFCKRIISSALLIYALRCVLGFIIGFALYTNYPKFELFWTLLSIILVISPEEKDSKRLSIERFKSNLIGSAVAMACLFIYDSNVYTIVVGMLITIIVCRIFNVMNMARVALVALLIIMVEPHHTQITITPIFRCLSVGLGCVIGLLIVIITSYLSSPIKQKLGVPHNPNPFD